MQTTKIWLSEVFLHDDQVFADNNLGEKMLSEEMTFSLRMKEYSLLPNRTQSLFQEELGSSDQGLFVGVLVLSIKRCQAGSKSPFLAPIFFVLHQKLS